MKRFSRYSRHDLNLRVAFISTSNEWESEESRNKCAMILLTLKNLDWELTLLSLKNWMKKTSFQLLNPLIFLCFWWKYFLSYVLRKSIRFTKHIKR